MAEKLGEALLDLDTNDRKFNAGVDRAGRKATALGRTFDDVGRRALRLGGSMVLAAGAAGAAFLTAGIVAAVKRLDQLRKSSAQVDQALSNSGNTARTSAGEIKAWADQLEAHTGRAAEEVMDVAANLASFGFGREEFYRAIALADDMSAAWGGDLRQNLEGLSRALDDPINGMAMLSKRGIKLTDDQKALAASFIDAGDKASAQGVVFEALEAQVKGVAEAGFGGLSAALSRAQNRWEDAFDDLVSGKGDAAALSDTLTDLANTLSSPEFIKATMGFGAVIITMIEKVAQATTAAWNQLERFFNWLKAQQPKDDSSPAIQAHLADEQAALDKAIAWRDQQNATLDTDLYHAVWGRLQLSLSGVDHEIKSRQQAIANLQAKLDALTDPSKFDVGATFDQVGDKTYDDPAAMWRALSPGTMAGQDDGDGSGDGDGGGGGGGVDDATESVEAYIETLKQEREALDLDATAQAVLNAQRQAGADATPEQLAAIESIVTETEEHRAQLEAMQEVYDELGDIGKTAVEGIVDALQDGKVEGNELLGILGDVMRMAGQFLLSQAFDSSPGTGFSTILDAIFSGFHADGGLIPNGMFGIVGEEGPEPVWGTSSGTRVMSNPDFMDMLGGGSRGDLYVTVNGSGLTQSQLTAALRDAFNQYDRNTLPASVQRINRDPHARG